MASLQFSNKLTGEWSASGVTGLLTQQSLEAIIGQQKWDALEPIMRARLLLSPLFLRLSELHELREPLLKLKEVGTADKDEWVRVIAAAVGPYDGRLHIEEVMNESKLVKSTLEDVRRRGACANPALFRPREVRVTCLD